MLMFEWNIRYPNSIYDTVPQHPADACHTNFQNIASVWVAAKPEIRCFCFHFISFRSAKHTVAEIRFQFMHVNFTPCAILFVHQHINQNGTDSSWHGLSALLSLCEGNLPVDSPHKGTVMRSVCVSFDVRTIRCWTNSRVVGDLIRHI